MVNFDIAPVSSSIIMVVGVGGGGSNAVNHMFRLGITDVSFMVCNTDRQALDRSPIPNKIRLGESLTHGLGAGNKPERGRDAAQESIEEIKELLLENNIRMVFITAGMGGGTGTGAAPVIAKAAKELGILTVAIVTIPFKTEGRRRILQAIEGIENIRHNVDSLLVVNNENIHEIYGELGLSEAFGKADDILATAAKSIAEIITSHHQINVDFADVETVMRDSGIALMGSATGSGENRAMEVAQAAMSSPLLNHKDISGAQNVLLNITSGTSEVKLSETYKIIQYIQERAGNDNATDLIWGAGTDENLGDEIRITVIATGFDISSIPAIAERYSEIVQMQKSAETSDTGAKTTGSTRQTVSLIDNDNESTGKKRPQQSAADEFALVTHNTHGSAYADPYSNSGYAYFEPQQQPVRIEYPQGSEPNPQWDNSPANYQQQQYSQSPQDIYSNRYQPDDRANYYAPQASAPEAPVYSAPTYVAPPTYFEPSYTPANLSAPTTSPTETASPSPESQLPSEAAYKAYMAHQVNTDTTPSPQQSAVVEATVPVPQTAETMMAPTPVDPTTDPDPLTNVTTLSEDELENIPAYIRRRMKIESAPGVGKVSRETLKSDSSAEPYSKGSGQLFEK